MSRRILFTLDNETEHVLDTLIERYPYSSRARLIREALKLLGNVEAAAGDGYTKVAAENAHNGKKRNIVTNWSGTAKPRKKVVFKGAVFTNNPLEVIKVSNRHSHTEPEPETPASSPGAEPTPA